MPRPLRSIFLLSLLALASLGMPALAEPSGLDPSQSGLNQTGRDSAPADEVSTPERAIAHPALWKVSSGQTTIYLFGTIHALPPGVSWFSGPVARSFLASDELVTEINDIGPEEMRRIVAAKAFLPDGENLRGMMSAHDRRTYMRVIRANGLTVGAFDRFRPWYAAVALSIEPLRKLGYDATRGVDTELARRAEKLGREHEALETPEYQLGLFAALPQNTQLAYLHEVVRTLPDTRRELTQMVRAWKSGDAARLARLMNADDVDPQLRNTLLVARNKAWAHWIKARLNKPGTVFIAVGAGHLAGPDSVQAQLMTLGIHASRLQ